MEGQGHQSQDSEERQRGRKVRHYIGIVTLNLGERDQAREWKELETGKQMRAHCALACQTVLFKIMTAFSEDEMPSEDRGTQYKKH